MRALSIGFRRELKGASFKKKLRPIGRKVREIFEKY
jgi:hypothetical protein